jgi:hypothetical protein
MSFGSKIGWSLNRGGWLALRSNVKGERQRQLKADCECTSPNLASPR